MHDTTGQATTAELFFGEDECGSCGKLAPMSSPYNNTTNLRETFDGIVYLLDGRADAPTGRTTATFEGGEAVFRILPRDGENVIDPKRIAIVTSNGAGIVGGTTFDPGTVKRGETMKYRFDLDAVETPSAPSTTFEVDPSRRILQWTPLLVSPDSAPCTMFEDVHDGMVKRSWFVPPNDHDCDGISDADDTCPSEWNGTDLPPALQESLELATCPALENSDTQCHLGVRETESCSGSPLSKCEGWESPKYCVSSFFCSSECPGPPLSCMDPDVGGTHFGQTPIIGVTLNIDPNTGSACVGSHAYVELGPYLALFFTPNPAGTLPCKKVEIWDVLHDRSKRPALSIDVKNSEAPTVTAPITLSVSDVLGQDSCKVEFHTDTVLNTNTTNLTWAVALDITLLSGHHVVLPTYFKREACNVQQLPVYAGGPEPDVGECFSDP